MEELVKSVVDVSKYLFEKKLVSGKAGNVSGRFKNDEMDVIAITPTMSSLRDLKEEDIVLLDIDGNNLTKGKPSSEVYMHLQIYKKRKDINGIVHTHSPYATGFTFSNERLKRLEGFGKIKNPYLSEVKYEVPGTDALAEKVGEAIANDDALILKKHGIITVGSNVKEAGDLAEFVEEIAKIQFISNCLNNNDNNRNNNSEK